MRKGLLLSLCVAAVVCATAFSADAPAPGEVTIFEPEDDWKEIGENQHLPGGLDIRIDFASGKKYARLIQKADRAGDRVSNAAVGNAAVGAGAAAVAVDTTQPGALVIADVAAELAPNGDSSLAGGSVAALAAEHLAAGDWPAELEASDAAATDDDAAAPAATDDGLDASTRTMRDVLLRLPEPEPELADAIASGVTPERLKELLHRVWERRQAQLKEAAAGMVTEAQQIQKRLMDLAAPYKPASAAVGAASGDAGASASGSSALEAFIGARVAALEDIEFHVSQLHNAQDFAAMGGISVVTHLLNDTSPEVASAAAWVLGTAAKYAPSVQEEALRDGAMVALLQLLDESLANAAALAASSSSSSPTSSPVPYVKAAGKAVYALGGLVRLHAQGQAQFFALGGVRTLAKAVDTLGKLGETTTAAGTASGAVDAAAAATAGAEAAKKQARGVCTKTLTLLADLYGEEDLPVDAASGSGGSADEAAAGGDAGSGGVQMTALQTDGARPGASSTVGGAGGEGDAPAAGGVASFRQRLHAPASGAQQLCAALRVAKTSCRFLGAQQTSESRALNNAVAAAAAVLDGLCS